MKRKAIITLLFAGIIALPLVFSGALQAFQYYIKYTVEERLQNETLTTISVPLSKVQWMEEGREILVEGMMFDIKSFYASNGHLVATGVYDERETAVMELLNNFNEKQQDHFLIQLLFLTQTLVGFIYISIDFSSIVLQLKHSSFFQLKKVSPFLLRFYPPPRRMIV